MSRRTLVNQLSKARDGFAGVGTRRIKIKLNKLSKSCPKAKAFRIALEIEDCNILAKKYFGDWKYTYYEKKKELIHDLIEIFESQNWLYGKHESDNCQTKHIIYFEIPDCEQISFHCSIDANCPNYLKEWDGKRNSTLDKLEVAICKYLDFERSLIK